MAEKDDSAWVFDSLVGFLQGPIWSAPLLTFIEEKSLIFEPGTRDSKDYREIFQEYKNLVDLLLGCYMEDMGISTEQFERACTLNRSTRVSVQFQQTLFEQIWAANDYEVFKRMMIQKNLELQLQALKLIEKKFSVNNQDQSSSAAIDNTAVNDDKNIIADSDDFDDDAMPMEELLHVETSRESMEKANAETAAATSSISSDDRDDNSLMRQEHERLAAEYRNESHLFKEALRKSTTDDTPIIEEEEENDEEAKITMTMMNSPDDSAELKVVPTSNEGFSIKPKEEANEEDIRKRQLYLKAQRDKLVALKKRTRSRKLHAADHTATATVRPSSARVLAEATVEGDINRTHHHQATVDPSVLQVRRALAARLKAEVVQK